MDANQQPESRLLGIPQAAIYLGSTVWAIRSLIWENQIPYVKIGKRLLLDRSDLDAFVDGNKVDKRKVKYGKTLKGTAPN